MYTDKTYDYIIYSVSLAGVITAIDLASKGKSVLLLNFYGFMGGSITESLNCYQTVHVESLSGSTKIFFNKIKNAKHGILYHADNDFVFNPETIKIVLQEMIEGPNVDLLFHIVPFYIKQKDDYVELSVTGKEGVFKVKGKTIIDASEEFDLLKLENVKRKLTDLYYNMFLTGLNDDTDFNYDLIDKKIKLDDNRYWISLRLPKPVNEFFIENNSQRIINEFEEIVQRNRGRIQLLAPQTQKIYDLDKLEISGSIFHIKNRLDKVFKAQDIFKECLALSLISYD